MINFRNLAHSFTPWLKPANSDLKGILTAFVLTVCMFIVRDELAENVGHRPMLILFVVPILVSSYIGGWKSGLFATIISCAGSAVIREPNDFLFRSDRMIDYIDWAFLWISGILICKFTNLFSEAVRKAEQAEILQKQLGGFLDQAISVANLGIFEHDTEDDIIKCSDLAEQIFGWNRDKPLTGSDLKGLIHPDDREKMYLNFERSQNPPNTGVFKSEHRILLPNGKIRWVRVNSQTIFREDGKCRFPKRTIGTILDITDAKEKQEALEVALESLEKEKFRAERIAEHEVALREKAEISIRMKDEFLAKATHELRTPLSVMTGWLDLLRSGKVPEEDISCVLDTLARNVKLELQLVEDILGLSQLRRGKLEITKEVVSLNETIKNAVESIRFPAEQKHIQVEVTLDDHEAAVLGDARRLEQIVWNLLTNAVKFTPRGGLVRIELVRGDGVVLINVSDNGIGIKPDFLPHIFSAFEQQDSSVSRIYGGLGLGLSIVKELTELHGGTIVAKSDGVGKGATFTLTLPLMPLAEKAEATVEPLNAHGEMPLADKVILAVDDMPEVLAILSLLLSQTGARVVTASSADEALDRFKEVNPDVLLSDISMPGKDGYDLIKAIRSLPHEQGGNTPAVVLSAHSGPDFRDRALREGFQVFLTKPAKLTDLLGAIQNVMAA